jgi:hypothetical protein
MRYGVFIGPDGYPTDMRNTNRRFDLWQIPSSDYPTDMRKSIPDQEMWPSDLFAPGGGACARLARDVFLQTEAIREGKGGARLYRSCSIAKSELEESALSPGGILNRDHCGTIGKSPPLTG